MAYLIRRKEPLAGEIRRILVEQNDKALTLLEHWQHNPRERVHSARQAFKRLRALLRLVRPGARYVYQVENRFYRDVGRSLAYVRDTEAVIEALAVVETSLTDAQSLDSLHLLRAGLERRAARELNDPVLNVPRRVQAACDELRGAERRLHRTPLGGVTRKVLRTAARRTMKRCEEGFAQVLVTGAAADFHAWRRDVKYAYHQTRLLQELMPDWAASHGPPLERLGELLGHSQDLTVLDQVLREQPDELNLDLHLQHMRGVIAECRRSAQEQARQLGAELFLQPPRIADAALTPAPAGEAPPEAATAGQPPVAESAAAQTTVVPGPATPPPEAETPALPANVVGFAPRRGTGEDAG
jgi:hypothetical protein